MRNNRGVINGYDFQLSKRGPISKMLLKELTNSQNLKEEKIFEIKNKELIKLLVDIFDKKDVKNKDLWAKSISGYMAILYIYEELLRVKPTKNELLETLVNLVKFEEKPDEDALKYAKILWNERKKLVKFEVNSKRFLFFF